MKTIIPQNLKKGDRVALLSPAGRSGLDQIEIVESAIKELGLIPVVDPVNFINNGYFAGTLQQRVDSLHSAFKDSSIKAIFCIRGGFGTAKYINLLDYGLIRANPKILIGMSDITVLQNAIYGKSKLEVYSGPMNSHFRGSEKKLALDSIKDVLFEGNQKISLMSKKVISEGSAGGVLLGGNLLSFNTLIGTGFMPEEENIILFLEEVAEHGYALDRAFAHLSNSGYLKSVKGLIIGDNAYIKGDSYSLSFEEIIGQYFKGIPIVYGAKFGHNDSHIVLPIGREVNFSTKDDSISSVV